MFLTQDIILWQPRHRLHVRWQFELVFTCQLPQDLLLRISLEDLCERLQEFRLDMRDVATQSEQDDAPIARGLHECFQVLAKSDK